MGEAAWRITCAAVLSVEPAAKSVTPEQMHMVMMCVLRLNEAMFWMQDTVKEGRASAAVSKLRLDVSEKMQMLVGHGDFVADQLGGGARPNRVSLDEENAVAAAAAASAASAAAADGDMNASPITSAPVSRAAAATLPTHPSRSFDVGFIACTMLVLLQAWKKQESARHPSATDIFANISLASRKCLFYGCKDLLVDDTGVEIFGVTLDDTTVVPPKTTPLPDPSSMNWREWAVVMQHPGLLDSLTTKKLGDASKTWLLTQALTINTIKNDTQWLPEGFATAGYVFADFSSSSSSSSSGTAIPDTARSLTSALISKPVPVDNDFFLLSVADIDSATADNAASASESIVASACERDFVYADALGIGFRSILLAGKSAIESAIITCAPLPLPLDSQATIARVGRRSDSVRMAMGMEEGPGRRRRKLKLVTVCGDYLNAVEARLGPNEVGAQQDADVTALISGDCDDGGASNDHFANLLPAGFSPSKKRPSLSM